MVRLWGGRVIRWGALAFAAIVVVVYVGAVIHHLQQQHSSDVRQHALDETAIQVAQTRIHDLETASSNLHVTVTNPTPTVTVAAPQVTVTMGGSKTTVVPAGGSTIVVPTPVPGPTVVHTATPNPPAPSPGASCGLLGLGCLLRVIGL